MFKDSKVLVTGGAGFIGTNLIKELLTEGARVRATIHNTQPQLRNTAVEYVKADLTREEDCRSVVKDAEYVFMCAANTSGALVIDSTPLVHVTPNWVMNAWMLQAAYDANVKKFLWISSNAVYPEFDYPVKESDAFAGPLYKSYRFAGGMKRCCEQLCEMYWYLQRPMQTVVVRPANAYGEYDDFEWATSHVIPSFIRRTVERHDPLKIKGGGKSIKDLIYVGDLVRGILLAMREINSYQPVNIGTGVPISTGECLKQVLEADGYSDARVEFDSSRPGMIPKRLIDVSLAKEILGFEAKTSFREGVAKTISWYRNSLKEVA